MKSQMQTSNIVLMANVAMTLALLLGGCEQKDAGHSVSEAARSVLYTIARAKPETDIGFSGTIEARYTTDLGFRTLGRLVSRPVTVGDSVKKGDTVAMLDPEQLDLTVQSAEADLKTAQAQYDNAAASERRQAILLKGRNVSQADYDAARQARDSGAANLEKARASLKRAQDQRGFAVLRPDYDGVVATTQAEVGQVVAAGQTVLTIARPDIREAVVDIPDSLSRYFSVGSQFLVTLEADPSIKGQGQVREVAPQADAQTRSRRVKLTLERPKAGFRLGAMVHATPMIADQPAVTLPLTALVETDGVASVWQIDRQTGKVSRLNVVVGARDQNNFIALGVKPGSFIATAGVHALEEGQTVVVDTKGTAL